MKKLLIILLIVLGIDAKNVTDETPIVYQGATCNPEKCITGLCIKGICCDSNANKFCTKCTFKNSEDGIVPKAPGECLKCRRKYKLKSGVCLKKT